MEIHYCDACNMKILDNQLSSGEAKRDGNKVYCPKCVAAGAIKTVPQNPPSLKPTTAHRINPVHVPHSSHTARSAKSVAKPASVNPAILVALVGVAVLVIGVAFYFGGSETAQAPAHKTESPPSVPQPPTSATPPPVVPPVVVKSPPSVPDDPNSPERKKAQHATDLLDDARRFAKEHPEDFLGYYDRLKTVATNYSTTSAAVEANKIIEEISPRLGTALLNLAKDPGFESGNWGAWGPWGNASIHNDPAKAKSGNFCLRIDPGSNGSGQTVTGLTPNATYTLSGWVRIEKGKEDIYFINLGVKDYGGPEKAGSVTTDSYTKVSSTFTMGANNTTALIYVWKQAGGYGYVDDILLLRGTQQQ